MKSGRLLLAIRFLPSISLLGLSVILSSSGCELLEALQDDRNTCLYGGELRQSGKSFPSIDGCNICTCEKGGTVACTLRACQPGPSSCLRTGCSGQICSDTAVTTTCEYRNEYACYKDASCVRQPDGKCAFTATPALSACLANSGSKDGGIPSTCDFAGSYEYGNIGGNSLQSDRSFLSPGNTYRHVRTPLRSTGPTITCGPAMPPCGSQDVITAYDIEVRDLTHPDVRAALTAPTPPLFGEDPRPYDGTVFEFKAAANGGAFLVGSDCGTIPGCRPIPRGIAQLRDRLVALDRQQLATPECKSAGFVVYF